jgi:hypothetical protein
MSAASPITILVCALGGEGGGVLAEWLYQTAVRAGPPGAVDLGPRRGTAHRRDHLLRRGLPRACRHPRRPPSGVQPEPGARRDRPAAVVRAAGNRAPRRQRHGQPRAHAGHQFHRACADGGREDADGRRPARCRGAGGRAAAPRACRRPAGLQRAGAVGRHRDQRGAAGRGGRQRGAAHRPRFVRGHDPCLGQGRGRQPARLCMGLRRRDHAPRAAGPAGPGPGRGTGARPAHAGPTAAGRLPGQRLR